MMEDRPPPDDDDPFEWTDAPARPRRRRDRETFNTGERDSFDRERDVFDTGEGTEEKELPRPGDPYEPKGGLWEPTQSEVPEELFETDEPPSGETGESDPYDTGERPYPTGEEDLLDTGERRRPRDRTRERRAHRAPTKKGSLLARHRELPAKARRRQAIIAGAVVVLLLVGGIVLASGGGGGDEEKATPLKTLAGQTIIAPLGERGADQRLLKQARKGQIGGIVVVSEFQPNELTSELSRLRKAARSGDNPPLLVMTDQEGGFVKRLPGPPDVSPNDLGEQNDPTAAKAEGQKTAQFLKPLGLNIDLAPLMDVALPQTADTIKTRTFSDDPAVVSEIGVAFIQGLQEGGVSATAKHFPGLGLSTVNTDFRRVDIAATPEDQDAALVPFKAAVDNGVDLVMMSSAIYPDLGSQNPASLSPEIVQGQLRDQLGYDGLIITDDLEARAIVDVTSPEEAAIAALKAGDDLLMFGRAAGTSRSALRGIVRANKKGALDRAAVQQAYDRVTAFKATLGGG